MWVQQEVSESRWQAARGRCRAWIDQGVRIARLPRFQAGCGAAFLLLVGFFFGRIGTDLPAGVSRSIAISSSTIDQLRTDFYIANRRPATDQEMDRLIEQRIQEEILFREGLRGRLYAEDDIVRRRLAARAHGALLAATPVQLPDEPTLREFFTSHAEFYAQPARISLQHVFFDPSRRGRNTMSDARAALKALANPDATPAAAGGDPFPAGAQFRNRSEAEIADLLGPEAARLAAACPQGWWAGPIASSQGMHLIQVIQRTEPRHAAFEEVREAVLSAYLEAQQQRQQDRTIEQLKGTYLIRIDRSRD
jgi:hypothetical protein